MRYQNYASDMMMVRGEPTHTGSRRKFKSRSDDRMQHGIQKLHTQLKGMSKDHSSDCFLPGAIMLTHNFSVRNSDFGFQTNQLVKNEAY